MNKEENIKIVSTQNFTYSEKHKVYVYPGNYYEKYYLSEQDNPYLLKPDIEYLNSVTPIKIETSIPDFEENGQVYIEEINYLLKIMPELFEKVAAEHLENAKYWSQTKIDVNKLASLLKVKHITLTPETENNKDDLYPCWWYFEIFIDIKEEIFADHGLVIKLDKNCNILASDVT